jgi:hypothetical protein
MLDAFCIETAYEISSCMPLSMKNRFLAHYSCYEIFPAWAPVLNFLCILSWIDVINCISNFRDYCYVIIMYSSVFNQVRRHKVLYFSSYTFLVHLDQRSMWTIAITCRPSSVNFSHFKLLRNHWADWNQT